MNLILPPPLDAAKLDPLSELEAGLAGPNAPEVRTAALARIDALELSLKAALGKGMSSIEYPQYAALLEACQASREVLKVELRRA